VTDPLEELVGSLVHEGYALYPYTPGATKNATPTPFGIVYPPAYAAGHPALHDHLRVECLALAEPGARVSAEIRFLQSAGPRHEAAERRLSLGPGPSRVPIASPPLEGRAELAVEPSGAGPLKVRVRVENATAIAPDADRAEALRHALLSTHVVLRIAGGRFVSPLDATGCENVNTWPVLATPEDDAVLAAAIVLPDHPEIAPESRGSLFDATEIEEALLLHVHTLSDAEREQIADQDPAVREMIARAAAATPEDLMRLHGRLRMEP